MIFFIIILIIFTTLPFMFFFLYKKNNPDHYLNTKSSIGYPILYINLKRSPDRKKFMEDQFKKYNIRKYHRIDAIDGKQIKNNKQDTVNGLKFKNNYDYGMNTELACTLSHIKAIKYAYDHNFDKALIVEDDCSFELMDMWHDTLENIVEKEAPKDWEILQLFNATCDVKEKKFFSREKIICWGATAYLINKKGMKKIVSKCFKGDELILGKIVNGQVVPKSIKADEHTYRLVDHVYYYGFPLFFPNNENLPSSIEDDKNRDSGHKAIRSRHLKIFLNK